MADTWRAGLQEALAAQAVKEALQEVDYDEVNSLLREAHLGRREQPQSSLPQQHAATPPPQQPSMLLPPPRQPTQPPLTLLQEPRGDHPPPVELPRLQLQRKPRKRYEPPKRPGSYATSASASATTTPPPFDELFRKYQQQGIKEWRQQYNHQVDRHYSALASGANPLGRSGRASSASGPVSRMAEQAARRHMAPITQFVAGEPITGLAASVGRTPGAQQQALGSAAAATRPLPSVATIMQRRFYQ